MCDEGTVRLSLDDDNPTSNYLVENKQARGRVEVCESGSFREVCRDNWNYSTASVVCLDLGFSRFGESSLDMCTYIMYRNNTH